MTFKPVFVDIKVVECNILPGRLPDRLPDETGIEYLSRYLYDLVFKELMYSQSTTETFYIANSIISSGLRSFCDQLGINPTWYPTPDAGGYIRLSELKSQLGRLIEARNYDQATSEEFYLSLEIERMEKFKNSDKSRMDINFIDDQKNWVSVSQWLDETGYR